MSSFSDYARSRGEFQEDIGLDSEDIEEFYTDSAAVFEGEHSKLPADSDTSTGGKNSGSSRGKNMSSKGNDTTGKTKFTSLFGNESGSNNASAGSSWLQPAKSSTGSSSWLLQPSQENSQPTTVLFGPGAAASS